MLPMRVVIIMTGTKTTTLVSALAATAAATSEVPFSAAARMPSPPASRRKMFSITMIELVTSTPTEQPSASRVMMLKE